VWHIKAAPCFGFVMKIWNEENAYILWENNKKCKSHKTKKKRHKIITKCSQKVEKKEKYGMIKIRTENYY